MKAKTISSRRAGLSSPSSACLSATLIDRLEATASARIDGSSISDSWIAGLGRKPLVELGVILELLDDRAHQRLRFGALGGFLLDVLDLGGQIVAALDEVDQPRPLGALDQHPDGAVGQLQQLHRRGDRRPAHRARRGRGRPRPGRAARPGTIPCRRPWRLPARRRTCRGRRTKGRCDAGKRRCREAAGSEGYGSWLPYGRGVFRAQPRERPLPTPSLSQQQRRAQVLQRMDGEGDADAGPEPIAGSR